MTSVYPVDTFFLILKEQSAKRLTLDKQWVEIVSTRSFLFRGVTGYLKLGGRVVMRRTALLPPFPPPHYYFAKNWVGNCPTCPPASYAPAPKGHFEINWHLQHWCIMTLLFTCFLLRKNIDEIFNCVINKNHAQVSTHWQNHEILLVIKQVLYWLY